MYTLDTPRPSIESNSTKPVDTEVVRANHYRKMFKALTRTAGFRIEMGPNAKDDDASIINPLSGDKSADKDVK